MKFPMSSYEILQSSWYEILKILFFKQETPQLPQPHRLFPKFNIFCDCVFAEQNIDNQFKATESLNGN